MVKKMLQVKRNNEVGIQSIGGASGITSMLSRGYESQKLKQMPLYTQQQSVNRLYLSKVEEVRSILQTNQQYEINEFSLPPMTSPTDRLVKKFNKITFDDLQSIKNVDTLDRKLIIDEDPQQEIHEETLSNTKEIQLRLQIKQQSQRKPQLKISPTVRSGLPLALNSTSILHDDCSSPDRQPFNKARGRRLGI